MCYLVQHFSRLALRQKYSAWSLHFLFVCDHVTSPERPRDVTMETRRHRYHHVTSGLCLCLGVALHGVYWLYTLLCVLPAPDYLLVLMLAPGRLVLLQQRL